MLKNNRIKACFPALLSTAFLLCARSFSENSHIKPQWNTLVILDDATTTLQDFDKSMMQFQLLGRIWPSQKWPPSKLFDTDSRLDTCSQFETNRKSYIGHICAPYDLKKGSFQNKIVTKLSQDTFFIMIVKMVEIE